MTNCYYFAGNELYCTKDSHTTPPDAKKYQTIHGAVIEMVYAAMLGKVPTQDAVEDYIHDLWLDYQFDDDVESYLLRWAATEFHPKTGDDWFNSKANAFCDFFNIGDAVGEDVVDDMINVIPPRTLRGDMVQMGEPYSHHPFGDRNILAPTFLTFIRKPNLFGKSQWYYVGHCFGGKTENIM